MRGLPEDVCKHFLRRQWHRPPGIRWQLQCLRVMVLMRKSHGVAERKWSLYNRQGIAMTDISVVRMSIRKKEEHYDYKYCALESDCCRLLTELSIKSACRNMSVDILMFFGSEGASCASFASMAFVRRVVDAPVCLLTVSSIASFTSLSCSSDTWVAPPRSITAISLNVTGVPALALSLPTIFTTVSQVHRHDLWLCSLYKIFISKVAKIASGRVCIQSIAGRQYFLKGYSVVGHLRCIEFYLYSPLPGHRVPILVTPFNGK